MNKSKRVQPNFKSAIFFIAGLAILNFIIIGLMDIWPSRALMFFGNVIGIGLLFPASLLYIQRKEKFDFERYLYFAITTMIVTGITMYMFVYRF